MNKHYDELAVVIPALEPTQGFITYTNQLISAGFDHIYVVNDGSDATYDSIFQAIATLDGCTVLTHSQNCGKGAALKTAYAHIQTAFPHCHGVLTADSDGQHAVNDVCKLADRLSEEAEGLVLGVRDFSTSGVPFKSLVGNRLSSLLFFLLHGTWVQDTQTGLRGFPTKLLPLMLDIDGDRFEYEMAVLTTCARQKIPVSSVPIHTIYLENNTSTHFRPLTDSLLVCKVLLARLCRFMLSSGTACILDVGLYWALLSLLKPLLSSDLLRIGLAVVAARLVSMTVNFTLNKGFVFGDTSSGPKAFSRYCILAGANMIAAIVLVYLGHTLWQIDERITKVIADVLLFIINYQMQRIWVFSSHSSGGTP